MEVSGDCGGDVRPTWRGRRMPHSPRQEKTLRHPGGARRGDSQAARDPQLVQRCPWEEPPVPRCRRPRRDSHTIRPWVARHPRQSHAPRVQAPFCDVLSVEKPRSREIRTEVHVERARTRRCLARPLREVPQPSSRVLVSHATPHHRRPPNCEVFAGGCARHADELNEPPRTLDSLVKAKSTQRGAPQRCQRARTPQGRMRRKGAQSASTMPKPYAVRELPPQDPPVSPPRRPPSALQAMR
mmetsp:Transcript_1528/g.3404  ORF Transcript_1528/g.3404 Transcript_1528/m.3404 type:complete len:241 (+) Transcript_1528:89-811(+)